MRGDISAAVAFAIERSADPRTASTIVDRLIEEHPSLVDELDADQRVRDTVIALACASRSLSSAIVADPRLLDPVRDAATFGEERDEAGYAASWHAAEGDDDHALRRWKRAEVVRIAARDLLGVADMPAVGRELAALAGVALDAALVRTSADAEVAIIGMGKLGGRELNYSSDVDVLFVHDGNTQEAERAAREVLATMSAPSPDGIVFRTDANLRPEGRSGPLTRTIDSYAAYYEQWGRTWEFQALLKARPVAGNPELGEQLISLTRPYVWPNTLDPDAVREIRAMKMRAETLTDRQGLAERELKRGRGGIRDVEFAVQLLQLVHGRDDPTVRSATTLVALAELAAGGYVHERDAASLDEAYQFLRTVEHRLQLYDEQQTHTVPSDDAARHAPRPRARLPRWPRPQRARGVRDRPARRTSGRSARSTSGSSSHRSSRPWPASGTSLRTPPRSASPRSDSPTSNAHAPRCASSPLVSLGARSSCSSSCPWCSSGSPRPPIPTSGSSSCAVWPRARRVRRRSRRPCATRLVPHSARARCSARRVSSATRSVGIRSSSTSWATTRRSDARRHTRRWYTSRWRPSGWRREPAERREGLRRFKRRELLRIASRDLLGLAPLETTERELTALADATLEAALWSLEPSLPFAIIGLGRLGGAELSYASDVDVVFVYDGDRAVDFDAAERVASTLLAEIGEILPEGQTYAIDARLRPEGTQGPLARSLGGYARYYREWALTWERQALVKARFVAGDPDVGERFGELVDDVVYGRPFSEDDAREVRRMKARIERERLPTGEDPQFHLKLGAVRSPTSSSPSSSSSSNTVARSPISACPAPSTHWRGCATAGCSRPTMRTHSRRRTASANGRATPCTSTPDAPPTRCPPTAPRANAWRDCWGTCTSPSRRCGTTIDGSRDARGGSSTASSTP